MNRLIFVLIILLAVFLRLYNLPNVPPSPSLDEVSIGYNAYSILKTGADEYGNKFPILLRAYDDWRPALYVYLVIPFVWLFNLTTIAVRLPSVILSVLTVIATYFLTKEIFKKHPYSLEIAGVSALVIAISPWHIYLSRLGHEANAGLAFFIFSICFFFRNNIYLFFTFLALSFVSYQSEKIFLPLFFLTLLFLFKERFLQCKKETVIGIFIFLAILFPFFKASLNPNALIRFKATNVLVANVDRFQKEALVLANAVKKNDITGKILHNRRIVIAEILLEGYFSHFNPLWLFANLSADKHKVPNLGLFYPWEIISMFLGIIFLFKQNISKNIKYFFLFWLLLAPLPAAITTDAPHAMRVYTFLPLPQIISGLGLLQISFYLKRYHISKNLLYYIFSFLIFGSVLYFSYNYYYIFPKTQSSSFQYALSQAIPFALRQNSQYNKIIFSNTSALYQSYMFFLFFSKYDPYLYLQQGGTISGGFAQIHSFNKYEFRPIMYNIEKEGTFLVGNISEFPININAIKAFSNLDKKEVIKIIKR